jgi:hypothetical protein
MARETGAVGAVEIATAFPDYFIGGPKYAPITVECYRESVAKWAHRHCHALSMVLHIVTGWPLHVLCDAEFPDTFVDDCSPLVVHSGVLTPEGRFIDDRGVCDASRLREYAREVYHVERPAWHGGSEGALRRHMHASTVGEIPNAGEVIASHLSHLPGLNALRPLAASTGSFTSDVEYA